MTRILMIAAFGLSLAACGDTSGGSAQKTGGDIKEGVGSVIGDKDLKREGKVDQAVGDVKDKVDKAADKVKDLLHKD